jgi:GT2 family glycosyltransferase
VPAFNAEQDLERCLEAINRSDWPAFECIVVDDASTLPGTAEVVERHGARLVRLEQRSGPGLARNAGVAQARGDVVFFIDADVLLHSDSLSKAMAALDSDPGVAAVFGSYDDAPGHGSFLSRYRNLYHHWNHQTANEEASTFWAGCGAIRKSVFLEVGGFSADYKQPSIEDIELGYRIREAGYRIRLLKTMFGTHLKHWRFWDMLRTDMFRRGVPWAALLFQYPSAPRDLNLNRHARIATVAAALLLLLSMLAVLAGHAMALVPLSALIVAALCCIPLVTGRDSERSGHGWKTTSALLIGILPPLLAFGLLPNPWAPLPLVLTATVVWCQRDFYRLLAARGGIAFAIAAVPLQLVFFIGCAFSVPLGYLANRFQT